MNKHFVLKSANKNINIVPKCEDFDVVLHEFAEFYKENSKLFNGVKKFNMHWANEVSYKTLYELEQQSIKVDIIKTSSDDFYKLLEKSPLILKRVIRGGEQIKHDGDVIIEGNVNPDAYVIATGDVYILGTLKGVVHAGYNTNFDKKIVVFDYETAQIRIGNKIKFLTKKKDISLRPKIISYNNKEISVSDF